MDLQYFKGMDIFAVTKSDRTIIAIHALMFDIFDKVSKLYFPFLKI